MGSSNQPVWVSPQKNMLSKVGIDWKYEALDAAARLGRIKTLNYDMRQGGAFFIRSPDNLVTGEYHLDGNWNHGRLNNKQVIQLIEQARAELDMNKRQQLYFRLDKALYDNYEDLYIWYSKAVTGYRKNVFGWHNEYYREDRAELFTGPIPCGLETANNDRL